MRTFRQGKHPLEQMHRSSSRFLVGRKNLDQQSQVSLCRGYPEIPKPCLAGVQTIANFKNQSSFSRSLKFSEIPVEFWVHSRQENVLSYLITTIYRGAILKRGIRPAQ